MQQCLNLPQTHTRHVLMLGKEGAVQCPCNESDNCASLQLSQMLLQQKSMSLLQTRVCGSTWEYKGNVSSNLCNA